MTRGKIALVDIVDMEYSTVESALLAVLYTANSHSPWLLSRIVLCRQLVFLEVFASSELDWRNKSVYDSVKLRLQVVSSQQLQMLCFA